ncbi:ATP-binding protein [Nonomuraea sp. JJY05]|uniref:ATP-binding protein n=1 Tax=Nonomuraea sp. JJY05 TaxID=3350255 RepID=UPI00373E851E
MWLGEAHPLCFDAEQVVAELVNNSVLHVPISGTRDWVRVHLGFGDDFIRLDVIDPGTDVPAERFIPSEPCGGEESGRGLQIASERSERWGMHVIEHGHRVVWCDLKVPDEHSIDDTSPDPADSPPACAIGALAAPSRINRSAPPPVVRPLSAPEAADELRAALARMGIPGDVHEGRGLALVSVWTGLVVWTDGFWYRWWTGRRSQTDRWLYAHHSAFEPERAARRIAARYAELREASNIVAAGVS